MVKTDFGCDHLIEELLERSLSEDLLAPSVDYHEESYQSVYERSFRLYLLEDSCNDLIVEERDAHEYRDLSHLHICNHPGYDDSMSEETVRTMPDCLKENCGAAVAVMKREKGIENVGLIYMHSVSSLINIRCYVSV